MTVKITKGNQQMMPIDKAYTRQPVVWITYASVLHCLWHITTSLAHVTVSPWPWIVLQFYTTVHTIAFCDFLFIVKRTLANIYIFPDILDFKKLKWRSRSRGVIGDSAVRYSSRIISYSCFTVTVCLSSIVTDILALAGELQTYICDCENDLELSFQQ